MKFSIALDDWKLPIFRRRLAEADCKYVDAGELMPGVTLLTGQTDNMFKLEALLEKCQKECADNRSRK